MTIRENPKSPRAMTRRVTPLLCTLTLACAMASADDLPYYLKDRGTGQSTSLFGTYDEKGEWLVYVFGEYTINKEDEYHGSELGYTDGIDYLGKFTEYEALVFVSYAFNDYVMFELEPAYYTTATLKKAKDDTTSGIPNEIKESGVGDVDMEVRWRYCKETEHRPEIFSYFEVTPGFAKNKTIIGTQETEYALGVGLTKGFHWGTLTGRVSFAHNEEGGEFSEYALQYVKRISHKWSVVAAIEGEQEDIQAIGELQWHVSHHCTLKFNSGFGVTQKAEDFAPEVGVLFRF
ncbi:MAG: hypothetical protein U0166_15010 [Acidobacteriota bacterium]